MKNTKKKAFTLVLGSLLLFATSCLEKKQQQETPESDEEVVETNDKVSKPKGIITLKEAKVLCDNYENRRSPIIRKFEAEQNTSESEFIPTQFVTLDFKTVEKYIRYVKRKSRRAGVKPDSLRIYLGNYGKDGRDPNKNTVFLLPATTIDNEYGGYYLDGKDAKLIRNYWPNHPNGSPKSKASMMPSFSAPFLFQGEDSFILNHGQSGPPPPGDF